MKKLLGASLSLAVVVVLWSTPPASAAPPEPVVSDLDSSTPGHVTGTITSPGAPLVRLRLWQGLNVAPVHLTLSADSGTFDLPTWGYSGPARVYARACLTTDLNSCSNEVASSATFSPTEVTPEVTWSSDATIGPGQAPAVTVDDTGGGVLIAARNSTVDGYRPDGPFFEVDPAGTTSLPFPDGTTQIHLLRCDAANPSKCAGLTPSEVRPYEIRRTLGFTWSPLDPITTRRPATTLTVDTDRTGTYDLDWHIEVDGQPLPEPQGSISGQSLNGNGALAPVVIDGTTLTDETAVYAVVAELTVRDPSFGDYRQSLRNPSWQPPVFSVDRTAPIVTSITFLSVRPHAEITAIYPNIGTSDRPRSASVSVKGSDSHGIVVKNASGTIVYTDHGTYGLSWDGKNQSNVLVPSGTYTVAAIDGVGNESATVGKLRVDTRRRVLKGWSRTVTAGASLTDSYVGRCSVLRRPAARGWAGSLGFYANTKCPRQTWRASAVSTVHSTRLPAADKYISLSVSVYGGAARARPGSVAGFRFFNNKGEMVAWRLLGARIGAHKGDADASSSLPSLVWPTRRFYWGVATAGGDRYDVKTFTIRAQYYVLV